MTIIDFAIDFHGPFIVSDGLPGAGLDHRVNKEAPLPNTQLRGLLRAHALNFLGIREDLIDAIFGGPRAECQWVFSDARIEEMAPPLEASDVDPSIWNRVQVDEDGRAEEGAVVTGEQVWAHTGSFSVVWDGVGEPPEAHVRVLRGAARDIVSLGLNRRRGFGWVSITDATPWTEDDTHELIKLIARSSPQAMDVSAAGSEDEH